LGLTKFSRAKAIEQFTLKKFKAQMMMSWSVGMKFILYRRFGPSGSVQFGTWV